jgi:hypothetical protein
MPERFEFGGNEPLKLRCPVATWLHVDFAFEGLRKDPGFRELLQPKG